MFNLSVIKKRNKIIFYFFVLITGIGSLPIKSDKCKINKDNELKAYEINSRKMNERINYYSLVMDVRFLVFHYNDEGKVPEKNLREQIDVLNLAFSGDYSEKQKTMLDTKIKFRINEIRYVNNKGYYNRCDSIEERLMARYSKKTDSIINIMVCYSYFYLGWAYYPWTFNENNRFNTIFIHKDSIPGGDLELYNKGMTLVHEMGHYFGLIHTFSHIGTCVDGDMIVDTPAEKTPSYECNTKRDTCPMIPGKDPVTNFMDYSPDDCVNEFTIQQINRMWESIDTYKPNLKRVSRDNFLRNYQESRKFVNSGKGRCDIIDNNDIKLQIYRFRNKNKAHITQDQCEQKSIYYVAQAYTYTSKKNAKNKLKYNCLIYKVNSIKEIDYIVPSFDTKYKYSNCYILKTK